MPKLIPAIFGAAMLLGAFSNSHAAVPVEDRVAFVEVIEGPAVQFTQIEFQGTTPGGNGAAVIAFVRAADGWQITFASQGRTYRIHLSSPDLEVHPQNVRLFDTGDGASIVLPFGPALISCFLNGAEVFRRLYIDFENDRVTGASRSDFPGCEVEYSDVDVRQANGEYRIQLLGLR